MTERTTPPTASESAPPTAPESVTPPTAALAASESGFAARPTAADARRWITADFGMHVTDIDEVTGGTDASAVVWRFVDDAGDAWAAKWTTRRTRTGTRLVGSMAAAGLDAAPPHARTSLGQRRSRRRGGRLAVSRWSDGQDAATVGLDLDGWTAYGALLADVHAHAFPLPERRRGARRGIRRRRRRFRAEIRALDTAAALPQGSPVLDLWRQARGRIALLEQGALLTTPAPTELVPCHGDAHLGNVLVEPSGGLRLVDWDEAVVGPRELDLHLVEFPVLFEPTSPEQLAAFRRGYGPTTVDGRRMVRFASIRALEDLTSTMTAALVADALLEHGDDPTARADRDEAVRVFTGILAPTGSASLLEERLRAALADRSASAPVAVGD